MLHRAGWKQGHEQGNRAWIAHCGQVVPRRELTRPGARAPASQAGARGAPGRSQLPLLISIELMVNDGNPMNCCMTLTTRASRTLSTLPTGPSLNG